MRRNSAASPSSKPGTLDTEVTGETNETATHESQPEETAVRETDAQHIQSVDRDIAEKITSQERATQLTPDEHADKEARRLNDLGNSLRKLFQRDGNFSDLEHAIINLEHAVQFTADSDADKPIRLDNLGMSLRTRFERLGEVEDIEKAIKFQDRAVHMMPDGNPEKPACLSNLGSSLLARFNRLGQHADFENAIMHQECAVRLTPDGHPNKTGFLNNLGISLVTRFNQRGQLSDLEKAIMHMDHAVQLIPDTNPSKPSCLSNLGSLLWVRFEQLGNPADIEKAITLSERAMQLTPDGNPDRPGSLSNIGTLLETRYTSFGELADIQKALINHERAVQLTPDEHPEKPVRLNNLGNALGKRFKRCGELVDLESAISCQEKAVRLTPEGHPNKPRYLARLGISLETRFHRIGKLADLEKAISIQEHAVELTQDGHPDKASRLGGLGLSLYARFDHLRELEDVEKAIKFQELALQLTPDGHPEKPRCFSVLGNSLWSRFNRRGELADLESAIRNQELGVNLTPDGDPGKPTRLNDLGTSLHIRFERLGDLADVEKAIEYQELAVHLTPDANPDKPGYLGELGSSLQARFVRIGKPADVQKAISSQQRAVQLTPDGHPWKSRQLCNLGSSLQIQFKCSGDTKDLKDAMIAFSESTCSPTGLPFVRLRAAMLWSDCARACQDNEGVMQAYALAFQLLPLLSWIGLTIPTRHHALQEARSLACDSAAAAIAVNDLEKALEWLEEGRSVVWGQLLQLRTPVDDLRDRNPHLAQKLSQVASTLEAGSSPAQFPSIGGSVSSDRTIQRHHRLADEWESLVKQVREMDGFENFLRPERYSDLRDGAREGPVVVLNVSEYRCDALILVSPLEPLHHVHLSDLTYLKVDLLRSMLFQILSMQGLRNRDEYRHGGQVLEADISEEDLFRVLLSEIWKLVVEPVIGHLESLQMQSVNNDDCLHIRWCPTGPLAFLPIHAAGLFNADRTSSISLADIAVSSYTPTLSALLSGTRRKMDERSSFKLLAVIQPNTPGASPLPGTREELKRIQKYIPPSSIRVLNRSDATINAVLSGMDECSWVHLACHGIQDMTDPMESGLQLENGRLGLSKIIHKRLPRAEFAFLSACQTATGDPKHQEEAIHIASGMLLAGYKGVVATMWSIQDDVAPFVADQVYSKILTDGQPNGAKPAVALHEAMRELRNQPGSKFSSWVPFVFMGV